MARHPSLRLRPRRSVLYLPASNARALAKAPTLPVDAVVLDLEDAVAPEQKEAARESACEAVRSVDFGHREVAVRVNAPGTPWHADDVAALAAVGPDAVVVPKVGDADDVRGVVAALEAAGVPDRTAVWAMVETPAGVLHAEAVAKAHERLTALVVGTNDLAHELGARPAPGRASLLTAVSLVLLAARAAGVVALDGVYNDVHDLEGLAAEARQGRDLGFDGKTVIHPGQVEVVNAVFTPDEAELAHARGVSAAFAAARAQGRAVATYEGRLVEQLHADDAARTLALAEAVREPRVTR